MATGKKGRRASLVIAETQNLLGGLAEDHVRSQNLMAELEALLASSTTAQATSTNFASVAPILDRADEAPVVEVDEFHSEVRIALTASGP